MNNLVISALKPKNSSDRRSVIHPETLNSLLKDGIEVIFESFIGDGIFVSDSDLVSLGAKKATREECLKNADFIFTLEPLETEEINQLSPGQNILGMIDPVNNTSQFLQACKKNVNLVSMEFIPRITRAQKMDVLSSQANLAGYAAVIEASNMLPSALPMMMTAAGTLKPARVFVIGVGVAGLQAIATAKRLGAKFVKIDLGETGQTEQGYAKELTDEQIAKQKDLQSKVCARSDIVITTAQLFGRQAPKIIDENTNQKMKTGSVIFDMAVESGGNVFGSKSDQVNIISGVKVVGISNLASKVAAHASIALSNNFNNWILEFYNSEKKEIEFDFGDEIISSSVLVFDGKILNERFKER